MASSADPQDGFFRRRALERQTEQESIDALLRVTAPHEWIIATGLVALLLACLAWGFLARIELTMQIDGVLAKAGERGVIVSALPGRILDLPTSPGDTIPAGATVATLQPAGLEMRLRLVEAREAALTDTANRPDGSGAALQTALQAARAERLELEALERSGSQVASSRGAEITALLVGVGEAVDAGTPIALVRFDGSDPPEAVVFLDPEQAGALQTGMAARIRYETAEGGATGELQAELSSVSEPRPMPSWLAVTPVGAGQTREPAGRLARFSIVGGNAPDFNDLSPARIEVTMGRIAPFELLFAQ